LSKHEDNVFGLDEAVPVSVTGDKPKPDLDKAVEVRSVSFGGVWDKEGISDFRPHSVPSDSRDLEMLEEMNRNPKGLSVQEPANSSSLETKTPDSDSELVKEVPASATKANIPLKANESGKPTS